MYNNKVRLPMVIRTPMGGRRGYGPTHSQTLEKLFMGLPGLKVVAPAAFSTEGDVGSPGSLLYYSIIKNDDPLIFIENKLQYLLPVQSADELSEFSLVVQASDKKLEFPTFSLTIREAPPATLTIAAYGYMVELARQAALRLAFEYEIFTEIVIPTQLAPFDIQSITDSTHQTGALLVIEEGSLSLGWGAEIVARIAESINNQSVRFKRIAALDLPVASSGPLEAQVLPNVEKIMQVAIQLQQERTWQVI
jgi:2-oxoisovalerate dehydrogenase E1 component